MSKAFFMWISGCQLMKEQISSPVPSLWFLSISSYIASLLACSKVKSGLFIRKCREEEMERIEIAGELVQR